MASSNSTLAFAAVIITGLLIAGQGVSAIAQPISSLPATIAQPTWCVAKPSVYTLDLQAALDSVCGEDPSSCQDVKGSEAPCYYPNTLVAHASYAFNQYWQAQKAHGATCNFGGVAALTTVNPSHGMCVFNTSSATATSPSPFLSSSKSWCVAKPGASLTSLRTGITVICTNTELCTPLHPGKPCHDPAYLSQHASYAFNAFWQANKDLGVTCDFDGAAFITSTDPSHDNCKYQSSKVKIVPPPPLSSTIPSTPLPPTDATTPSPSPSPSDATTPPAPSDMQWCIAKNNSDDSSLQEALNFVCGSNAAFCTLLENQQPCFNPNTLLAHASFAMNSYWQANKATGTSCDFGGIGQITNTNPGHDGCVYESNIPISKAMPPHVPSPAPVPQPPTMKKPSEWCIVRPAADLTLVLDSLYFVCRQGATYCAALQSRGPCFLPYNLVAHASYAFNAYWQANNATGTSCDFHGLALLSPVDPSHDTCVFASNQR